MKNNESPKSHRKTREVSSRFQSHSPIRRLSPNSPDPVSFRPQFWPSSSSASSLSNSLGTLADHLTNDRLTESLHRKTYEKSSSPSSRTSGRGLSRLEIEKNGSKKTNSPIFGGPMRYTGKPTSSSIKLNSSDLDFVPRRFSVDEIAFHKRSSSSLINFESELSDAVTNFSPVVETSSKKLGKQVPSKYMNDILRSAPRKSLDSNIEDSLPLNNSTMLKKVNTPNATTKVNSFTRNKTPKSQRAVSPVRSGSPPISVDSKEKLSSFSSLKPPTDPCKLKAVDRFLNLGFSLFKNKKCSSSSSSTRFGYSIDVHHLRLLYNRLLQWRYANAAADAVNGSIFVQAERNLLYVWDHLIKLRRSVMQKKIQYVKEKIEMKLNFVLSSQIKLLEAWGGMERQHLSGINLIEECLHSVICRVPLIEGAEVDMKSAFIALGQAFSLTASINSILTRFSPSVDETTAFLSELVDVVQRVKLLLEEFHDLFQTISILELQERSLKCSLIQLNVGNNISRNKQPEITSEVQI